MRYFCHPEYSLDNNYILIRKKFKKSLGGWMKEPKKGGVLGWNYILKDFM